MSSWTTRDIYFTKHLFKAGLQCPTKLYYYSHEYPQNREIRPFLEHAGYNKRQLKALLRVQYPDGIKIREVNYEAASNKTEELLGSGKTVLFDPVFINKRRLAKIPVLVKNKNQVQLYFVQTKVFNPNKHRLLNHHEKLYKKWAPYIFDAAFHVFVIQQMYPDWDIHSHLLLPDKTAGAQSDNLYKQLKSPINSINEEQLFHQIDITPNVATLLTEHKEPILNGEKSFKETVELLSNQYFSGDKRSTDVGLKCKNCEFCLPSEQIKSGDKSGFNECWNQSNAVPQFSVSEPHVFDLIGPGLKRWAEKGVYLQKNIPLSDLPSLESTVGDDNALTLKQRQTLQVRQAKGKEVPKEIIKQPIIEELNRWQYPLHFLDFEAGNYAVPIRKGRGPYHLVLFQYSCHTLYDDGTINHSQWIAKNTDRYPNYDLVRQLMKVPAFLEGTIIQYSNFERTALKKIRRELAAETEEIADAPELIEWLGTIIQRNDSDRKRGPYMADLSRLVKKYYYNLYMANSLSIKDVVQSVLTVSEPLKEHYATAYQGSNFEDIHWWQWDKAKAAAQSPYAILKLLQPDVKVGRGTEAMVAFGKVLNDALTKQSKERVFDALLKYCELDTLAMVMIYQHWKMAASKK